MNVETLKIIEEDIKRGKIKESIQQLSQLLKSDSKDQDKAYYLLGNAYSKINNWPMALNNYQYALNINPKSPAKHARKIIIDIMNFYNKDMFNQ